MSMIGVYILLYHQRYKVKIYRQSYHLSFWVIYLDLEQYNNSQLLLQIVNIFLHTFLHLYI